MERWQRGRPAASVVHSRVQGEVVALVAVSRNTAASVARDLELTETAVRKWVNQADIDEVDATG